MILFETRQKRSTQRPGENASEEALKMFKEVEERCSQEHRDIVTEIDECEKETESHLYSVNELPDTIGTNSQNNTIGGLRDQL